MNTVFIDIKSIFSNTQENFAWGKVEILLNYRTKLSVRKKMYINTVVVYLTREITYFFYAYVS